MVEGKQRLQLIDGGRLSSAGISTSQLVRQPKECDTVYRLEPCVGELTTAYQATERRLSRLLEDRSRIGRDLHDCVLQSLYAIGLNLETSQRIHPTRTPEGKASTDRLVQQINQLIHEVRGMIRTIESGAIQEFDLRAELFTLCSTYEQSGQLLIKLDLQPSALEVLTTEEEHEILGIIRESLSNCVRHADATHAIVSVRKREGRIRVSVFDDGVGFVFAGDQPRGYGLTNMEARAKKLGGVLRIQSKLGQGTHVITEFSLEPLLTSV